MTRKINRQYIAKGGKKDLWHLDGMYMGNSPWRAFCGEGPFFGSRVRQRKPRIHRMCPICQAEWERLSGYRPPASQSPPDPV